MNDTARFGFARKPAPTICPDCGAKLGPINHGRLVSVARPTKLLSPPQVDGMTIWRACTCGCFIRWTSRHLPNHIQQLWERRHVLPIFDLARDIVQMVDA